MPTQQLDFIYGSHSFTFVNTKDKVFFCANGQGLDYYSPQPIEKFKELFLVIMEEWDKQKFMEFNFEDNEYTFNVLKNKLDDEISVFRVILPPRDFAPRIVEYTGIAPQPENVYEVGELIRFFYDRTKRLNLEKHNEEQTV